LEIPRLTKIPDHRQRRKGKKSKSAKRQKGMAARFSLPTQVGQVAERGLNAYIRQRSSHFQSFYLKSKPRRAENHLLGAEIHLPRADFIT